MRYRKISGTFAGSNGHSRVYCYQYIPEGEPVGIVQIVHGMCEYLERYEPFIEFLLSKGLIVCGNDHLGHGRTGASDPQDTSGLGFMGSEGWKFMVEDLDRLRRYVRQQDSGLPYYMIGHSMGSFLTRAYISRYQGELDGVILCGTAGSNPLIREALLIARRVIAAKGGEYRSTVLNRLAFGMYNRKYTERHNEYDWLSRDVELTERYAEDPYCNYIFTADGFQNLFSLLRYVSSADCYRAVDCELPMLIISGDMDPVGDYGRGVREVYRRYRKAGVHELSMKLYSECRHELFNETNKKEIYNDVFSWLQGNEIE